MNFQNFKHVWINESYSQWKNIYLLTLLFELWMVMEVIVSILMLIIMVMAIVMGRPHWRCKRIGQICSRLQRYCWIWLLIRCITLLMVLLLEHHLEHHPIRIRHLFSVSYSQVEELRSYRFLCMKYPMNLEIFLYSWVRDFLSGRQSHYKQ